MSRFRRNRAERSVHFVSRRQEDRRDFGLTWNQVLEAGGVVVGDEIKISVDVELTAVPDVTA